MSLEVQYVPSGKLWESALNWIVILASSQCLGSYWCSDLVGGRLTETYTSDLVSDLTNQELLIVGWNCLPSNHIVVSLARLQATDKTKRIQADEHFDPKPFSLWSRRPSCQAGSPAVPARDVPLPAPSCRTTSNQNALQDLMISPRRLVLLSPISQWWWEARLGSHPRYGGWQCCPQGAWAGQRGWWGLAMALLGEEHRSWFCTKVR